MNQSIARREFLAQASVAATGLVLSTGLPTGLLAADKKKKLLYKISLTQYSLHRTIGSRKLDNMDFTSFTRKEFDIDAVEWTLASGELGMHLYREDGAVPNEVSFKIYHAGTSIPLSDVLPM